MAGHGGEPILDAMVRPLARTLVLSLLLLAMTAPVALAASGHDGGEGLVGETNDKIVTNWGFGIIAFFPLFILFASLLQWRLDKRKERRVQAARMRQANEALREGR